MNQRGPTQSGSSNFGRVLSVALSLCLCLLLLSSARVAKAQDAQVEATVTRDKIQIADPFKLEIRVAAPRGTQVSFPVTDNTLGVFDVLDVEDRFDVPVTDQSPNDRLWVRSITLETLATGQVKIPSTEVAIKRVGQSETIVRAEPITMDVRGVVEPNEDLTKFKDIAGVHDVEIPASALYRWIWLALGAALVVGLAGAAMFATRRKATASAKAWALERLHAAGALPEAETTVRQFIEERFECTATSLPIAQIIAELRSEKVDDSALQNLQAFLSESERVKFGGLDLQETEKARLLNQASQLIETLDRAGGQG